MRKIAGLVRYQDDNLVVRYYLDEIPRRYFSQGKRVSKELHTRYPWLKEASRRYVKGSAVDVMKYMRNELNLGSLSECYELFNSVRGKHRI